MKPVLKIKGKVQNIEKKEKNKPLMKTNFLLTINTNQQYKDNDKHLDDDIKIFENTIQEILNKIDEFINLPQGDKWDDETIKDVDIDYTIERGTKKGQLHIHILFKFKHHTKIQLNYQKIKEAITKRLGLSNIYMYNKLVRNSGNDNIIEYLNKYV
jgi:tRNA/tmRNA/rRNA uracil-C5-methylase (TrmA/RlmC/RlmD family)